MLFCNGQLPERAEDVGSRDELDASYGIQTGIQVRKGPALANDMTIEGMTITNTETRATILLCDKNARLPRGLGRCSIMSHFSMSWTHLSMTAVARGLARYGARSTGRVSGGNGNVASALVQRPSSDIDMAKDRTAPGAQINDCGFLVG